MEELTTVTKVVISVLLFVVIENVVEVEETEDRNCDIVGAVIAVDPAVVIMVKAVVELSVPALGVSVIVVKTVVIAGGHSGPLSHFCSEDTQTHCLGDHMSLIV